MKEDTKWRLRDIEGKEYIIIDSEKVDMQEELNKMITKQMKEIERLNNIINECAEDILKEIQENHHLSCGVALAIRQKLIDYREIKGDGSNE